MTKKKIKDDYVHCNSRYTGQEKIVQILAKRKMESSKWQQIHWIGYW